MAIFSSRPAGGTNALPLLSSPYVGRAGGSGWGEAVVGPTGPELTINSATQASLRADKPASLTLAGGRATQWASHISGGYAMSGPSGYNQPYKGDEPWVRLYTESETDPRAQYFEVGGLSSRYQSQQSDSTGANLRLGIAYMLFRVRQFSDKDAYLLRVGANDATWAYGSYRAYCFGVYSGKLRAMRGDGSSNSYVEPADCPLGQWVAAAFVLNDDRTTLGTSDNITRVFLKTAPSGAIPLMASASTGAKQIIHHTSTRAMVNRALYNGSFHGGSMNMDLAAFYFDATPPRTDGPIEGNLDILLGRVA